MKPNVRRSCCLLVALVAAGCSGSNPTPAPLPTAAPSPSPSPTPAQVASLSIALSGAPSFATAQPATTYPIVLKAFDGDGRLITGAYAQQVIVVLSPPLCEADLGLQGGFTPTGPIYVPVTTGVCAPGTTAPYSATAVMSSSTAIALTWDGTPVNEPGLLEAYATGVPEVTLPLP